MYAGVLGPLALVTVILRGVLKSGSPQETMLAATICLMAFAAVGYVVGQLAERVVEESVRGRLAAELASQTQKIEKPSRISAK